MIIVDRILDDIAVCEKNGCTVDIPLSSIVGVVREGDALRECGGGTYTVAAAETKTRRANISERFDAIKMRKK